MATLLYSCTPDRPLTPRRMSGGLKWLWSWTFLWHESMGPFLREHLDGKWDHKKIKRARRTRRLDLYAWLVGKVDAPELAGTYQRARAKHEKTAKKA